jgi:hypothetical protein
LGKGNEATSTEVPREEDSLTLPNAEYLASLWKVLSALVFIEVEPR